jgi:predicted secreted acid phosphatase
MQRDEAMMKGYARQLGVDSLQVEFAFQPGDWVLMKQKRPGKMLSKALGPYKFVGYKNEHGVVAVLETIAGK